VSHFAAPPYTKLEESLDWKHEGTKSLSSSDFTAQQILVSHNRPWDKAANYRTERGDQRKNPRPAKRRARGGGVLRSSLPSTSSPPAQSPLLQFIPFALHLWFSSLLISFVHIFLLPTPSPPTHVIPTLYRTCALLAIDAILHHLTC
jgi:hypothetical protein